MSSLSGDPVLPAAAAANQKLLTCEFDDQMLQIPGLLGAMSPRLESGWQSSNIGAATNAAHKDFEDQIISQLPPLIRPTNPAQSGPRGPVPLSSCFTWTRFQPKVDEEVESEDPRIQLVPVQEPEVVVLLTSDQIKGLMKTSGRRGSQQPSTLDAFGTCLQQLGRPVTCILWTGVKLRASDKKRSSVASSDQGRLTLNQVCSKLAIQFGVRATRICSQLNDVAGIVASYTRSIGERPFKEGRLLNDGGLAFLPDTVRMGLSGCASRGRGAGPAPAKSDEASTEPLMDDAHEWANRVWLAQLGQWRGLTGDIAHAVSQAYPTAYTLFQACQDISTNDGDFATTTSQNVSSRKRTALEASLANLEVRRGAGVLATSRRLGPEYARRLVTLFSSEDPNLVI